MTLQWRVRQARASDATSIRALVGRVFEQYALQLDPKRDAIVEYCADTAFAGQTGNLSVAEQKDILVGVCGVRSLEPPETAELRTLYCLPKWHGTGLAQALMRDAVDWCRASGYRRLRLQTDMRFERAMSFYEKIGFQRHGSTYRLDDINNSWVCDYVAEVDGITC